MDGNAPAVEHPCALELDAGDCRRTAVLATLPTKGIVAREFEHAAVAFVDLQNGLKLAVWPRADLAHDTGLS